MERVVFVEVLGRRGEVAQRVRLAQLPATLGRAWSCDVILADPLVDPQHARLSLSESGELVLEDLGSVNGLHVDAHRVRVPLLAVGGLATVRLGRTTLRIAAADHPVPPALRDLEHSAPLAGLLDSRRTMIAAPLALLLAVSLSVWLADYQGESVGVLAAGVIGIAVLVLTWAGIWAFAGRLIVHRAGFWRHVTLISLVSLAFGLWGMVASWASFITAADGVAVVGAIVMSALFVVTVAAHAGLASAASWRRRSAFGVALTAGFVALAWVGDKAAGEDNGNNVAIGATLKPLPASWVPARSVADFLEMTSDVRREVDELDEN